MEETVLSPRALTAREKAQIRRRVIDNINTGLYIRSLGEGSFGCVLEYRERFTLEHRAIKVQVYGDRTTMARAVLNEMYIAELITSVALDGKMTPGIIRQFKMTVADVLLRPFMADTVRARCPNFYRKVIQRINVATIGSTEENELEEELQGRPKFAYQILELSQDGDLKGVLDAFHFTTMMQFDQDSAELLEKQRALVLGIAFQIAWTLYVLQESMGFRHYDLKPGNILVFKVRDSESAVFEGTGDSMRFKLDDSGVEYVAKLADFGKAQISSVPRGFRTRYQHEIGLVPKIGNPGRRGTLRYMCPAQLIFTGARIPRYREGEEKSSERVPISKQRINFEHHLSINHESDMWALGIIIVEMCLVGWIEPWMRVEGDMRRKHPLFLWHLNDQVDIVSAREMILELLTPQLRDYHSTSHPAELIEVLFGMAGLNRALGNDSRFHCSNGANNEALEEIGTNTSVAYAILHSPEIQAYILEAITIENPDDATEEITLYDRVVHRIRQVIGDEGVQLVKRLLQWAPNDRAYYDRGESHSAVEPFTTEDPEYFFAVLSRSRVWDRLRQMTEQEQQQTVYRAPARASATATSTTAAAASTTESDEQPVGGKLSGAQKRKSTSPRVIDSSAIKRLVASDALRLHKQKDRVIAEEPTTNEVPDIRTSETSAFTAARTSIARFDNEKALERALFGTKDDEFQALYVGASLRGCDYCHSSEPRFIQCSRCQGTSYCSHACFEQDWARTHRNVCSGGQGGTVGSC